MTITKETGISIAVVISLVLGCSWASSAITEVAVRSENQQRQMELHTTLIDKLTGVTHELQKIAAVQERRLEELERKN